MIGFIGLGIMGKPMVKNLLKSGLTVRVNDLVQDAVDEVAALGAIPSTQAQIGAECDIVFTILPNGAIVRNVLFGETGVAPTLRQGALVVDMSSVTPAESRACAERLAGQQVSLPGRAGLRRRTGRDSRHAFLHGRRRRGRFSACPALF